MTQSKSNFNKGVDYIGITCIFYCHDGKGNFLLHRRSENCKDEHGRWDCGGGGLEFGEEFEEAVRREIAEEYCTEIVDLKYVGIKNVLRLNREGNKTHWVAIIYLVQVKPELVKIGDPDKMLELGWFKPDNFPKPLHSQFLSHFQQAIKVLN